MSTSKKLISRIFHTDEEVYEAADTLYDIQLGESIASARKDRNLTQGEFAVLLGVSQPDISRMEKGGVPPSHTKLKKIARKLRVKLKPPQLEVVNKRTVIGEVNDSTAGFILICADETEESVWVPPHVKTKVSSTNQPNLVKI